MNKGIAEQLKRDWRQLVAYYSTDNSLADKLFNDIAQRYTEPHRHYHTLEHLQCMFADLEEPLQVVDVDTQHGISFAVWFHDVIYQPGNKDNEALSADYATEKLNLINVPNKTIAFVKHAILCTKHHHDPDQQFTTQLFLDADMAILGKPSDEYLNYANNVRLEFKLIPEAAYRNGRSRFLQSVLEKPRIFITEQFFCQFNEQAIKNIHNELS